MLELLLTAQQKQFNPGTILPPPTIAGYNGQGTAVFIDETFENIYTLGGYGQGSTASKFVAKYRISDGVWNLLPNYTRTDWNTLPCGINDNTIIVVASAQWSSLKLPSGSWVNTAITSTFDKGQLHRRNGKFYCFGRDNNNALGTRLFEVDPVTRIIRVVTTFSPISKLWIWPATVIHNDKFYVAGDNEKNLHWYDFNTQLWDSIAIPDGYRGSVMGTYEDKIYLMGDGVGNRFVKCFDPITKTLTEAPPVPLNIIPPTSVVTGKEGIYCLSRGDGTASSKAVFWIYQP